MHLVNPPAFIEQIFFVLVQSVIRKKNIIGVGTIGDRYHQLGMVTFHSQQASSSTQNIELNGNRPTKRTNHTTILFTTKMLCLRNHLRVEQEIMLPITTIADPCSFPICLISLHLVTVNQSSYHDYYWSNCNQV